MPFAGLSIFMHMHKETIFDYFVSQAIANSPLLKDYNNQVRSFSLDSQLIRAALKLQVNGISNNSYAPIINGWGYDPVITNFSTGIGHGQVSKAILTGKNTSTQIAGLELQGQAISKYR